MPPDTSKCCRHCEQSRASRDISKAPWQRGHKSRAIFRSTNSSITFSVAAQLTSRLRYLPLNSRHWTRNEGGIYGAELGDHRRTVEVHEVPQEVLVAPHHPRDDADRDAVDLRAGLSPVSLHLHDFLVLAPRVIDRLHPRQNNSHQLDR